MTQDNSAAGNNWIILSTPDEHEVVFLLEDIKTVWSGVNPGTILIELISREEPVVVLYSSVKRFASTYLPGWDDRKKGRKPKTPPRSLRVVGKDATGRGKGAQN